MPDTTGEDGFIRFKDISGATVKVKADDVATILGKIKHSALGAGPA